MVFTFKQQRELEQLRAVESQQPEITFPFNAEPRAADGDTFEDWLILRLQHAKINRAVNIQFSQPERFFQRFQVTLIIILMLLGLFSTASLISTDQQQVNLFWLLGALLGVNGITLCIWLVVIVLLNRHNSGLLSGLLEWVLKRFFSHKADPSLQQSANLGWWQTTFSPQLQSWRFSFLTHLAWLSFLLGSMLGLFAVFMTQQYDFIWESTLLNEHKFTAIIENLSRAIEFVGLPPPPLEQQAYSPESLRQQWAMFVFSCLMMYALAPRAIALLVASAVVRVTQAHWKLDLSNDYYIALRSRFNQDQWHCKILDDDDAEPASPTTPNAFSTQSIPKSALWYGLEVNPELAWGQLLPRVQGLINDRRQAITLQTQLNDSSEPFVLFVEGRRLPDRGLMRSIKGFNQQYLWLAIVADDDLSAPQQHAWLKATQRCSLNPQQCVLVRTQQ